MHLLPHSPPDCVRDWEVHERNTKQTDKQTKGRTLRHCCSNLSTAGKGAVPELFSTLNITLNKYDVKGW